MRAVDLLTWGALAFSLLAFPNADLRAETAPPWKCQNLDGKSVQLSDFRGKVIILDFWATWCPPCRAEIPNFIALQKKYGKQGMVVIGISLDEGGIPEVASFAKRENINYTVIMGNKEILDRYGGVEAIPTTFVIDSNNNIVSKHEGFTSTSVFEAEIVKLLPLTSKPSR